MATKSTMSAERAESNGAATAQGQGSGEAGTMEALAGAVRGFEIPPADLRTVYITLVGTSELVCHRFSDKARKMMLDAQRGKANAGKEPKDPARDYQESLYPYPDGGYGFKAVGFKKSMVRAGTYLGMTMVYLKGAFHIVGVGPESLVKIDGEPRMREDPVVVGRGVADLRYRGAFFPWRVVLEVRYNARAISAEQLLNLAQHAGFSVGVGENRPEKGGDTWGMFEVATS